MERRVSPTNEQKSWVDHSVTWVLGDEGVSVCPLSSPAYTGHCQSVFPLSAYEVKQDFFTVFICITGNMLMEPLSPCTDEGSGSWVYS